MIKKGHGGDIYTFFDKYGYYPIDFSSNVNPLGIPENVLVDLRSIHNELSLYPDVNSTKLQKKIAFSEGISSDFVLCGNGAADLIYSMCSAISPRKAMVTAPTFSEYSSALNTVNCKVNYIHLKEENDFSVTLENVISVYDQHDLIFICSPNNPTGRAESVEELCRILDFAHSKNMIVVIDHCFIDFVLYDENYSLNNKIASYDNLIILKAFTKIYAMAGVRLGYIMSKNIEILDKISLSRQPWSVSYIAQICGEKALDNLQYIQETKSLIAKERQFLQTKFTSLGIKFFKSDANYILFKTKVNNFQNLLENKGILIRSCANYEGLTDEFYRVAIKNREENSKLVAAMEEIING